jgi:uncharacterized membrane protein YqjE
MTPIQLTLLIALAIMLASVLVFVWSTYRWLANISKARLILSLEETPEYNRLLEKLVNKANQHTKLIHGLHPFVSQVKYMFIPTLVVLGLTFLF